MRSTQSKNPEQLIRNKIRQTARPTWVWLDRYTLWPMRLAMKGVRFRITPSQTEVEHSLLAGRVSVWFYPSRLAMGSHAVHRRRWQHTFSFDLTAIEEKMETLFGEGTGENHGFQLSAWFERTGFRFGDSILATIVDWEKGRLLIEHEPASQRRQDVITHRNPELADPVLSPSRRDPLRGDLRLHSRAHSLCSHGSARWLSWRPLDRGPSPGSTHGLDRATRSAMLTVCPRLWRRSSASQPRSRPHLARAGPAGLSLQSYVQAPARAVAADRDPRRANAAAVQWQGLSGAFDHDWDHMGGFWKRVRHGQTKRFARSIWAASIPSAKGHGEHDSGFSGPAAGRSAEIRLRLWRLDRAYPDAGGDRRAGDRRHVSTRGDEKPAQLSLLRALQRTRSQTIPRATSASLVLTSSSGLFSSAAAASTRSTRNTTPISCATDVLRRTMNDIDGQTMRTHMNDVAPSCEEWNRLFKAMTKVQELAPWQ